MSPRRAAPIVHPNRAFSVGEAQRHGVSRQRLRAADFEKPFYGIRAATRPMSFLDDRCRDFLPRMPLGGVYSHVTAAGLYSMPLPSRLSGRTELHISVPSERRAVDAKGIIGHRTTLGHRDSDRRFGYLVTTPERTWCDLAAMLTLPELVAVGDKLIARRLPQCRKENLTGAVERHGPRRGVRNLRRAIDLLSDRAESPRESLLRVAIILAGLPAPTVNKSVFDASGRFLGRLDLSYPHLKLSMEYQGDHHRTDRVQWQRDIARTRALQAAGWTELQFTQADLDNPAGFIAQLRFILARLTH
ncbi:hypothetical protein [Agreia sp. COWG]|uniref:hypothetical protein n=1 Tax=Agreia sp. COWG TaxID=2773266 RepID=UPI001927B9D3|nr:hypothetical protein [Agreia sp. COWG]